LLIDAVRVGARPDEVAALIVERAAEFQWGEAGATTP
jgi:hypothetical protein